MSAEQLSSNNEIKQTEVSMRASGLYLLLIDYFNVHRDEVLQNGDFQYRLGPDERVSYSTDGKNWKSFTGITDLSLSTVTLSPAQVIVLERYKKEKDETTYNRQRDVNILRAGIGQSKERKNESLILFIPHAQNPYREALIENGISDPERQDITVNLSEILQQDADTYRLAGLDSWADNITSKTEQLIQLFPEKFEIIKREIEDGAIPIFMPGKQTQKETTIDELARKLKPVWKRISYNQEVKNTDIWGYMVTLADNLVADLPENPYINLIKPTQKTDTRTIKKTRNEQLSELVIINIERKQNGRQSVDAILPYEYAALQAIFTDRLEKDDRNLPNISPLDKTTYTRFISLPASSMDCVPSGSFRGESSQLSFSRSSATIFAEIYGFRFSVRVEIKKKI